MADIFISYSKIDMALAKELAAFLMSEGYTVWYDKDLNTGECFSDEIDRELESATVVIAIWTESSIVSKWVRAEAARANANLKLVPIKQPSTNPDNVPLPFNDLHMESTFNKQGILKAVARKIAQPRSLQTSYKLLLRQFRYKILTWFGIVGTALTIISSIQPLVKLSYLSTLIIDRWSHFNTLFWSYFL